MVARNRKEVHPKGDDMKKLVSLICVLAAVTIGGCAADVHRTRVAGTAPIFSYLSLKDSTIGATPTEPLTFPTRVSIVYAPPMSTRPQTEQVPQTTLRAAAESLKTRLLAHSAYVKSVVIGHTSETLSLEQTRNMYGCDIVVILSYSQLQNAERGGISKALDITLIGGHLYPGVTITTETGIEATVIHTPTQYILFTESGSSSRTAISTPGGVNATAGSEAREGFTAATDNLADRMGKIIAKYDATQQIQVATLGNRGGMTMQSLVSMAAERQGTRKTDSWEDVNIYKSSGRGALDCGFGLVAIAIAVTAIAGRNNAP
jgi:rhombotail lipoprotein